MTAVTICSDYGAPPPPPPPPPLCCKIKRKVKWNHSVMFNSLWPQGTAASQVSRSFTVSQHLLKLLSVEPMMPSNYHPMSSPSFPSIRIFSNESVLHIRWPNYWSFRFSISPSNEYSGLISFRINGLDLLAVQGILKSLLQHQSSKASILHCSAFFIVQLSQPKWLLVKP